MKVNFLQVGCADCTIVNATISNTALGTHIIDCNRRIEDYRHLLPGDRHIRAVFITHQHYDHFEGLHFLFDYGYSIENIIISPYERRYTDNSVDIAEWNDCDSIVNYFRLRGTNVVKPFRQDDFTTPFWQIDGIKYWMLGPYRSIAQSSTRELHDASLVFTLESIKKCVFTGDASDTSLNWIANKSNNLHMDILHASHHGSINGADLTFIQKCSPDYTIISTQSGVHDSIPDSTALSRYRNDTKYAVYRTDIDGSISFDI